MRLSAEFREYILTVRGYAQTTAEGYGAAITDFERTMGISDPALVTISDLDRYLTRRALQGLAASTRRSRAHALKSFFRFLKTRGHIPTNPALALKPPEEKLGQISTLTQKEIVKLIFGHKPGPLVQGRFENDIWFAKRKRMAELRVRRDSALLGLMYVCGLRVSEIPLLRVESVRKNAHGACYLLVMGKHAKEPTALFVDQAVARLLETYLYARMALDQGHPALFPSINKRRKSAAERDDGITVSRVNQILVDRIRDVGIDPKRRRISPHILRYSLATHQYENRNDLLRIQAMLRHASLSTTRRYIRLGSLPSITRSGAARLPWNNRPAFTTASGAEES